MWLLVNKPKPANYLHGNLYLLTVGNYKSARGAITKQLAIRMTVTIALLIIINCEIKN